MILCTHLTEKRITQISQSEFTIFDSNVIKIYQWFKIKEMQYFDLHLFEDFIV